MKIAVLFRNDLRLHDHPALMTAAQHGEILPIYVMEEGLGTAFRYWTHKNLLGLQKSLTEMGGTLYFSTQNLVKTIATIKEHVDAIYFHRSYHPDHFSRDAVLEKSHPNVRSFEGSLLLPPWKTTKENGDPYKVFSPFYKNARQKVVPAAVKAVQEATFAHITSIATVSSNIESLNLHPHHSWTDKIDVHWMAGEEEAIQQLKVFVHEKIARYKVARDFPIQHGSSELSPYLAVGALSVRSMYHYLLQQAESVAEPFIRQLFWREFAYHILFHFPKTLHSPLNPAFAHFPWQENAEHLTAWKKGETGIPLVDAGMKELWETGYMHNRVRMNVASYLTKHLLLDYRKGMAWFWDTLIDADIANNIFGWQWASGCGADAAPYFRIFNPYLQAEKFDSNGLYQKEWLPNSYEENPIVSHDAGRKRALLAYEEVKNRD
ncbi:cryptochrome/photolyase family protein [Paenisporosarcina cavernae]|uniref:Deoxyribodipyrimidine photo-lyase n=1 Tax=Paenisporosarcina cavernae TaxID=2320858 RepID=A0A385YUN8_9BACL|nr:deoxyribodipyrimidine photo-lyase [Paenisporosarcina cavernae]AYC30191.1 deoxyribodipyrimidine photo-lyase [Paenisporosarcina cavernae]